VFGRPPTGETSFRCGKPGIVSEKRKEKVLQAESVKRNPAAVFARLAKRSSQESEAINPLLRQDAWGGQAVCPTFPWEGDDARVAAAFQDHVA
jgi:hypothetical protein